jgi:ribosomal protein S19
LYNEDFLEIIGTLWQVRGIILDPFVKKTLKVHRGNKMLSILLKSNMVGFSLSDFFVTKKMGKAIHKEKKKKKKSKKRGYLVNPVGVRLQFHNSWVDAELCKNYIILNFCIALSN